MPRVIIDRAAHKDLKDIWQRIALEYQNPEAARKYLLDIRDKLALISEQPKIRSSS